MAKPLTSGPRLVALNGDAVSVTPKARPNRVNLFDLAYEQLEDHIVACNLKPGQSLTLQELQRLTGYGRTPIHQAVNRLSGDTLILIRPRHGLQIAPVDLARDRLLLRLRRDVERFVVRLATERAKATHRSQLLHIARSLRAERDAMTLDAFNRCDRRLDQLLIAAAAEPFLEHTLRPLHSISRRVGWLYHRYVASPSGLFETIDSHIAVLEAVAHGHADEAEAATDRLIDFMDSMFHRMEREIDPTLLDCSFEPLVMR